MNRDDIIRMAQEAGFYIDQDWIEHGLPGFERFAELVRADEREACAEIAEKMGNKMKEGYEKTNDLIFKFNCYALEACATSIRARGKND
jgi:hypothetical protein